MTARGRSVLGKRLLLTVIGLVIAALLTGCVGLPTSGPVVPAKGGSAGDAEQITAVDAEPPQEDDPAVEIVKGFLAAMEAWPIQVDVAREYLTKAGAAAWDPTASTIVYDDALTPQYRGSAIDLRLFGAERIDSRGSWQGPLEASRQQFTFDLQIEDGQYRISRAPNALLIPADLFAQRYRQVSLYFFDVAGRILVPEPVFVPRGDQFATTLTEGVLRGPQGGLSPVLRTRIPPGLSAGLSVTVSGAGVADIGLSGDPAELTPDVVQALLVQLGWTLRQDPSVRSIRLSIEGEDIALPGRVGVYQVTNNANFDPTGYQASPLIYGLSDGLLVSGPGARVSATTGAFGLQNYRLRTVGVSLNGAQAAGVSSDGTRALVADVEADGADGAAEALTVLRGATDLLRPVWDYSGRLWLLDRTERGAVVRLRQGTQNRTLRVKGVTGEDVRSFLVSRDGTRFVAVVRGKGFDEVRAGRLETTSAGQIIRATPTRRLPFVGNGAERITDIAWVSPNAIALLSRVGRGRFDVRTLPIDGAPSGADALSATLEADVLGLAGTPAEEVQYAVTPTGLIDLDTSAVTLFPSGRLLSATYVG